MSNAKPLVVQGDTHVSNRLKKETAAKKAKYDPKGFSLDPLQFTWNPFCRRKGCYGRGYIGFEEKSKKYLLCRCASPMKEPVKDVPKKGTEGTK